ncbi:hypothetical protein RSAG8_13944, partial [Rhizoctonia solani AG-8 WAC10335]
MPVWDGGLWTKLKAVGTKTRSNPDAERTVERGVKCVQRQI